MAVFMIETSNTLCESPTPKETRKCLLSHLAAIAKTKASVPAVQMTIENAFLYSICMEDHPAVGFHDT